jgi:hypothetical protein
MMDRHYTPDAIATALVQILAKRPAVVADFAAGDGALLRAARRRWPDTKIVATDIDPRAVGKLLLMKRAKAERCDFLSSLSRGRSRVLTNCESGANVVLLNPPFTCPGSITRSASIGESEIKCSVAMAFVLTSIKYLATNGVVAAILPASCMTSDKDSAARAALSRRFQITWKTFSPAEEFAGCAVSVVFMLVEPGEGQRMPPRRALALVGSERFRAVLTRGTMPMNKARDLIGRRGLPLVHTTSLQNNRVHSGDVISSDRSLISGPAIFLPRVGKFRPDKIALKTTQNPVVISDCVFAIRGLSVTALNRLFKRLVASADYLSTGYSGSCAKYITTERLQTLLININVATAKSLHVETHSRLEMNYRRDAVQRIKRASAR